MCVLIQYQCKEIQAFSCHRFFQSCESEYPAEKRKFMKVYKGIVKHSIFGVTS